MKNAVLTLLVCAAVAVLGVVFTRVSEIPSPLALLPHSGRDLAGRVVLAGPAPAPSVRPRTQPARSGARPSAIVSAAAPPAASRRLPAPEVRRGPVRAAVIRARTAAKAVRRETLQAYRQRRIAVRPTPAPALAADLQDNARSAQDASPAPTSVPTSVPAPTSVHEKGPANAAAPAPSHAPEPKHSAPRPPAVRQAAVHVEPQAPRPVAAPDQPHSEDAHIPPVSARPADHRVRAARGQEHDRHAPGPPAPPAATPAPVAAPPPSVPVPPTAEPVSEATDAGAAPEQHGPGSDPGHGNGEGHGHGGR